MEKIIKFNEYFKKEEKPLNEGTEVNMINALKELEAAWNNVSHVWYNDDSVEDAMIQSNKFYPFKKSMDEIDLSKWIETSIKYLKATK